MKLTKIEKDIPSGLIDVHNLAFRGFFLTSLGSRFLKLYYSSVLKSDRGLVVCLQDDDDKILGFAVGTTYSKGFHKTILFSNIFSYIWVLLFIIFTRPKAIFRLLNNLNKSSNEQEDDGDYAELLSIGIPPQYKGLGYGKLLLNEFEKNLIWLEVEQIALTTDCYNNDDVIGFYHKMGYGILYEFSSFPDRRMLKLIKTL